MVHKHPVPSDHRALRRLAMVLAAAALVLSASAASAQSGQLWFEGPSPSGLTNDAPLQMGSFARLAGELSPAVVSIRTTGAVPARGQRRRGMGPFGPGGGLPPVGQGSGFIINPDGHILTNAHVISDATKIEAHLLDGRTFEAEVIGVDQATDLALIKITSPQALPHVTLGDSDALGVGEWVMAIGNPLGLEHTVTVGIVSAKGRRGLHPGGSAGLFEDFIQTDASINPGNSGGPLFNIRGEVVGINTAINPNGQNLGFSVPINMAKTLAPMLLAGQVERSWIGILIQPMTQALASSYGFERPRGAIVADVVAGGPADRAGLEPGDVILSFGGREIDQHDDLPWLAATAGIGERVALRVLRGERERDLTLTLAARPRQRQQASTAPSRRQAPRVSAQGFGVSVDPLAREQAQALGLDVDDGVLVTEVPEAAAASVLQPGDVIMRVGDQRVRSPEDFAAVSRRHRSGDVVRLLIVRGKARRFVAFTL